MYRKQKFLLIFIAIIILIVIAPQHLMNDNRFFSTLSEQFYNKTQHNGQNQPEMTDINLYSRNAIVIRLNDNQIMLNKDSEDKIYPASLTKIMTAIVAIENISNLQKNILLPKRIFTNLYNSDASMAGFLPNEEVSALDLLYGTLLPSGAEASIGLAESVAGSESHFVTLMNEKAKDLGMNGTHFTNSTGLHDPNHFTSVRDLSILLKYALGDETFRDIFTSASHTTSPTNFHPNGITLYSTMFKNIDTAGLNRTEIIGGKTGYTEEAGLCLASLIRKNGQEFVMITAGADGDHKTEQFNIMDAFTIYDKLLTE